MRRAWTVNIRGLELDFFMLFLQEHPAVLLGKQTVKSTGTGRAKGPIRDLDKAIEDATSLSASCHKALEAKLTALVKEREAAGRELEVSNLKMMAATGRHGIREHQDNAGVLCKLEQLRRQQTGAAMVKAIEQLKKQLDDNETARSC